MNLTLCLRFSILSSEAIERSEVFPLITNSALFQAGAVSGGCSHQIVRFLMFALGQGSTTSSK